MVKTAIQSSFFRELAISKNNVSNTCQNYIFRVIPSPMDLQTRCKCHSICVSHLLIVFALVSNSCFWYMYKKSTFS